MEHKVWKLFKKEKYTEEGVIKTEQIYDFIESLVGELGHDKVSKLTGYWSNYSSETFWILSELSNTKGNE
jgi:hypothetical protein